MLEELLPHRLTEYLYDLASEFNIFRFDIALDLFAPPHRVPVRPGQ